MSLSSSRLTSTIKIALNVGAQPTSLQNSGMSSDIVNHVSSAIVANAPGTIMAEAPSSGGPISNGTGTDGTIALIASALEASFASTFGTSTPQIKALADAISNHISGLGKVSFAIGDITGVATNTPVSPGELTAGAGMNGTVGSLSVSVLAQAITSALGQSTPTTQVTQVATAIINEVQNFGTAAYEVGSVTGTFSAGGGPMVAGTGIAGTIS